MVRVANMVFQKSLETSRYRRPYACPGTGGASLVGALFRFLSGVTEVFCKIESKLLNSRVLAGGSVMGCAKKVLVLSIYKKVVKKSEISD